MWVTPRIDPRLSSTCLIYTFLPKKGIALSHFMFQHNLIQRANFGVQNSMRQYYQLFGIGPDFSQINLQGFYRTLNLYASNLKEYVVSLSFLKELIRQPLLSRLFAYLIQFSKKAKNGRFCSYLQSSSIMTYFVGKHP